MEAREKAEPPDDEAKQPGSTRKTLLRVLLIVCLVAIVWTVPRVRAWLTADRIRQLTDAMGVLGPVGLIALGAVGPIFFVPRAPICLVSGLLYGVTMGTAVGMAAGTSGAILQYYLSMGLLSRTAERLTPRRWQRPLSAIRTQPFSTILMLRLLPLSNASIVNMMAGLLRVPFLPYLFATLLGTLPITIVYALWGKTAKQPRKLYIVVSILLLLILTLITRLVRRSRWFRR